MKLKIGILTIALAFLLAPFAGVGAGAQESAPVPAPSRATPDAAVPLKIEIVYLSRAYEPIPPLSLLEPILTDQGVQGARMGIDDLNAIGRLIGQDYSLVEAIAPEDGDVIAMTRDMLAKGHRLIVADLEADDLLKIADLPEAKDAMFLNIRESDNTLREERCRRNVFHIIPNWAMRADALAQYLVWKKWTDWLLIRGKHPDDIAYAESVKRAARFGGEVVEERVYQFEAGSRRQETGHQQIQTQMPLLTQGAEDHDIVIVADTREAFGEYLLFRTDEPTPVAGTQGLTPVAWHRSYEQYGGMQLQSRFEEKVGRIMTERDHTGWLAVRIFGEGVARTSSNKVGTLRDYILSDEFTIGGFKGLGMNFRKWNNQLRQPVLIAGPRALVSVSPQEGFLHPKHLTDTLGFEEAESKCRFKS